LEDEAKVPPRGGSDQKRPHPCRRAAAVTNCGSHFPTGSAMAMRSTPAADIDAYIAASPASVRPILKKIRATIRAAAPDAEEVISYRMPAFKGRGILVYFAAFKAHIGVFPPVKGDAALMKALKPFSGPKGNLKFPLEAPMPYSLLARIVKLRVKQDAAKTVAQKKSGRS
jgi:uncharacterized protein YdhG (YjbR/CyaY superfamily)